jgi:hypothetical protein
MAEARHGFGAGRHPVRASPMASNPLHLAIMAGVMVAIMVAAMMAMR